MIELVRVLLPAPGAPVSPTVWMGAGQKRVAGVSAYQEGWPFMHEKLRRELDEFLARYPATSGFEVLLPDINGIFRGIRAPLDDMPGILETGAYMSASTMLLDSRGELPVTRISPVVLCRVRSPRSRGRTGRPDNA